MADDRSTPAGSSRPSARLTASVAGAVLLVGAVAGVSGGGPLRAPIRAVLQSAQRAVDPAPPTRDPRCALPCAAQTRSIASPVPGPDASGRTPRPGDVVSVVARCAPRGHDSLFTVTGDLRTHGDFVAAARAGVTLALPFGSYDLATVVGAEQLCAALRVQQAALGTTKASPRPDRAPPSRAAESPRGKSERTARPSPQPSDGHPAAGQHGAGQSRSAKPRPDRSR